MAAAISDIFISYARERETEAKAVAEALTGLGYGVWRDDQLQAGQIYSDVIEQRLKDAKAVVVLWSAEAVTSQWVRSEAERARAAGTLVQVNLDGAALPIPFDQVHCADIRGWRGEADVPGWRQTLASLERLIGGDGRPGPAPRNVPAPFSASGDKPSIAVLPFANLSGDPDQDYFVDGLMEEVVTCLTRIRSLFVIASGSSFSLKGQGVPPMEAARKLGVRYVVEGSVRKAGDRVRISIKMIDGFVGSQIWAERFDGKLEDIFELQDQVATAVAGVIETSVEKAEIVRALNRPTSDLKAYDLFLRGMTHFRTFQREEMFTALALMNQAIDLDPNYALALCVAGACHAIIMSFQWSGDPVEESRRMMEMIERSLRHGSDDAFVLGSAAMTYWAAGDFAAAAPLAARAVDLNPGSALPLFAKGQIHAATGDLEVAEDCILRSMELDPISPSRSLQLGALVTVRFAQQRFAEVVDLCLEWRGIADHPMSNAMLASANGHLGNAKASAEALAHLDSLSPMSMPEIAAMFYRKTEHRDLFLGGLALARAPARSDDRGVDTRRQV